MIRTALKTVFAHKVRLALTAMSVVLGVAFVAGTFIFTDTIDKTFSELFEDVFAGQDVIVQATSEFEVGFGGPAPIDGSVLDTVLAAPGVEAAEGSVGGFAIIYDNDGEAIVPSGPPTLGGSWTEDARFAGNAELRAGSGPTQPDEVAVDAKTADTNDLEVGDVVKVQTQGEVGEYTITGIVGFGEADNLAGATFAAFELETAQRLFGLEGQYNAISVLAADGTSPDLLQATIAQSLPEGVEAVTAADEAAAQSEALSESLGFLRTALLVFALVAVFVATFIIQNTFQIIVSQRQRELALMRAVGATGSQVVWLVVLEALIVGVVASIIGIFGGLLISGGLTAGMAALGFDLPSTTAPLAARTIIVAMAVGIVVTVASAVIPALRASKIPPVAAMQDTDVTLRMSERTRLAIGFVAAGLGLVFLLAGLFISGFKFLIFNGLGAVGLGAGLIFIGISVLSSRIVQPAARFLGKPLPKLDELTGTLATENAARKPRRTATTASALMIGLALVAFFFVLGDSIKASSSAAIEQGLRADYVISSNGFSGFGTGLSEELESQPEIAAVTPLRFGFWDRDGSDEFLMSVDTTTVEDTIFLDVQEGSLEALGQGGVFVLDDIAAEEGWSVGDTIPMGFAASGLQQVQIVGTYSEANVVQSNFVVGQSFYEQNFAGFGTDTDFIVAVKAAEGAAPDQVRTVVESAAADYPQVTVRDQAEYRQSQEDQVNVLLVMFNALLVLAVLIAVFGITNTLALSVYERTREIGLLRAVGMSRRQVRRMIRWESVIVAVIGAVLGVIVGLGFGVVVTAALASEGINVLSVPVGQILGLVLFGAIAGLLAAIFPARKASRLNILEAIAHE